MSSESRSRSKSRSGSSRSSSSRSSSSSSAPEKGDLKPVVNTDNGETSIVAVVLGMMTTLLLIFGLFGFGSEPIVNEEYNAEQLRKKELRYEKSRADSIDQLAIKLSSLSSAKSVNFNDAVNSCQQRIKISKEIIDRGTNNESIRRLAVNDGILAHIKLYGLDYLQGLNIPNISADLESAYRPYLEDKDQEVYQHARMGLLTHQSFEQLKADNDDISKLVSLFADTIERFPDSEYVSSMIEAHMLVLIKLKPDYASSFYDSLEQRFDDKPLEPAMATMMANLSDRLQLHDEQFDRKFDDRWADGAAGRSELLQSIIRMLGRDNTGVLLLQQCLSLEHWFEQNGFHPEARELLNEILAAANRGGITESQVGFAKRAADAGLQRLDLQGKTIDYRGIDMAGKMLNDAKLKKEVVIVVYWSTTALESLKYLGGMTKDTSAIHGKPITVIAVCNDEKLPDQIRTMRKTSQMIILEPEFEGEKNSLVEACVPYIMPHVMLIGLDGKVADVNVDPKEVKNKALALLIDSEW